MKPPTLAARSIGLLARITRWVVKLSVFFYLCGYAFDMHERRTKEPACRWMDVPSRDAIPYVARWCKLTKDTVLLRLYDATEQNLLAERAYFQLDRPNLGWANDYLWYDTHPDDAFIALPPSMLERLRAKLP